MSAIPAEPHVTEAPHQPPEPDVRERARAALTAARSRTLALTDCLDEAGLTAQHSRLMSPLVWDLAHIGNQEDQWLVRAAGAGPGVRPDLDPVYDAFQTPRADRPALPVLPPDAARRYLAEVRERAFEVLENVPLDAAGPTADGSRGGDGGWAGAGNGRGLTDAGFVFGMVAQHEQQHDETMLATHQLRRGPAVLHAPPPPAAPDGPLPPEVLVPAGPFTMGTDTDPWALDNERGAHRVEVPAFWLDTTPVTNAAYTAFIEDGGYEEPRWWHPEGWTYVRSAGLGAPLFWRREGTAWTRRRFGTTVPVAPEQPVVHVSWYEADAYARWAGRRLPTEAEWEKAARHDPATGRSRRHPWGDAAPTPGHANLGQRHLEPAPAGAYPAGAAPSGARQLLGDVWEWTSSGFTPYPGFAAYPYDEYSKVFFGPEYKVLRGGSFGTDAVACRSTFRNWDYPVRRQIFAGFRTARDAAAGEGAAA
ncbi:ergothioneine biosynthesis protein EgtB [Streptomyces sp. TRM 70351]|uniref:ergothioneine biosynthesis protein EgtB n=1 Tax=Streptomyces sp. TRM 70351 TaxID=3116552 RepID=UPI002E7C38C8|nr:ergothioneine biosynthesis protein EgtB [Streptomyces sp. TRM 70351]MEE1930342.1 ergothioneine biosynthesis protein EgtB [Streptomyces sp. TRM 70351]